MANTLWLQGRYQEALRNVWASNEIAGAAPDSAFRLNVNYQLLGLIYWELNEFDRAHEALDEAVRQAWRAEMPLEAASAHNNRGIVFRRQKKYRQALASMDEALKIDERLRSRWGQGYDHRNIGITLHRMGYHEEAARHLETAVRLSGEIDDAVNLTRALYALGDLRLSQERLDDAEELLTRALESARAVYMPEVEWRALRGLGLIRKAKGDRAGAIEHVGAAVEVVESVREGLKVEEFRSGFLTNKMDLYEDMVGLLLDAGRAEDALSYAERSRSRNFLDILARQSFELKTDRERRLYEDQGALAREIRSLTTTLRQEKDEKARAALAEELQKRRKRFADLLVEIRAANPQLSSFVSVEVVPVRELAEALGEDVSLVVYYVMKDEVAIWVVRGGELTVRRVKVDRRRLTEQVRAYRLMVQRRELLDEVRVASQALHALLLAPVEDVIAGSGAVGIVPHRALHCLSFASLYDGQECLVERYPLFYAPSASVLARTLGRAPARPDERPAEAATERRALRVLAVGNPAAGDPAYDLPFSEREVESLARDFIDVTLLVGEKATESWVAEHIGGFDVIHLAAHGYFDSVNPLFSALMLAPDPEAADDGTLELHEVSGLEVNARLVVLSACQSALGDLRAGDELVSLSRAFMYAGTPAIVSTLWRVDDVATA
ncbi:MAG: CHAT domain-containing tetratricopeptide repeat protein, partial [Candidatus Brocadiia bacterium]|nr:CHAT domain-containing tetratricopeptide repeat protein [Candidatus Brocadiia bacterium]